MGQCSWLTCRGETDAQRELIRENNFQEEPNSHIQKLDYLSHKPNWFASPPLDTIPINVVSSDKLTAERAKSIQNLLYLDHLTETENTVITELISQHQDLFVLNGEALGATNAIFHQINTIDDVPVFKRQYRFPPIHKDEIIKQCTELEARGIIKPSDSPYSSPIWIVPKKEDSLGNKRWRMVIDYRSLNEKTIGDAYPLPNINEILDQLGNAQYFSSFDLASGFHQIPIHPNDTHKTAFSTPYQHYEFTRMPFGLKNAPPTFQRMMDKVLIGLQGKELFVYMDDIVIYSQTLEEHVRKFQNLSERLRKAGLQLEPDKCHFLKKEINYLGHIISSDGVRPEPKKLTAVQNFPRPTNQKNIRQFLGLTGYYRRFIPNYAKIAKPLTSLLMKDKKFQWGDEENKAFSNLRNALCKSPILQYPDFTKEFVITTDACGYGIAGILSQGEIGKDLPIAYISRVLGKSERNYSTIEKEMLAIIYAVNYFRPYVYGRKFTLVTDHRPLTWINSVSSPNSRIVRWRLSMQDFDYRIVYKPGLVNANADALSRNIPFNNETECDNDDTLLDIKRIFTIDSDTSSSDSIFTAPAKRKKKEVTKALTKRSRVGSDDIDIAVDNSTKSEDSENVGRNKRSNIADEDITQQTGSSSATEILAEHPASEPLISPEGNDSDNEHNHSELSSNGGLAESERSSESYPASVANNQDIDPSHYLPPAACDEIDETFFDDGSLGLADFTEIMSDMFIFPEDAQDNNSTDILRTDPISNQENEAVVVDVPDSDDSSDSSEEIFPTARVPFENQRQRENKERLPPNSRIISDQVIECRDNLAMRQDNYLIFTSIRGEACDNGALEILHTIDCPINDLTLLRVKVIPYKKKLTLILPLRNNRNNIVVEEDIREGLQSVHNAIIDLNIKSISIAKTDQFDDVPWNIIEQILVDTFAPIDVKITICTQEVIIPNEHDRSEITTSSPKKITLHSLSPATHATLHVLPSSNQGLVSTTPVMKIPHISTSTSNPAINHQNTPGPLSTHNITDVSIPTGASHENHCSSHQPSTSSTMRNHLIVMPDPTHSDETYVLHPLDDEPARYVINVFPNDPRYRVYTGLDINNKRPSQTPLIFYAASMDTTTPNKSTYHIDEHDPRHDRYCPTTVPETPTQIPVIPPPRPVTPYIPKYINPNPSTLPNPYIILERLESLQPTYKPTPIPTLEGRRKQYATANEDEFLEMKEKLEEKKQRLADVFKIIITDASSRFGFFNHSKGLNLHHPLTTALKPHIKNWLYHSTGNGQDHLLKIAGGAKPVSHLKFIEADVKRFLGKLNIQILQNSISEDIHVIILENTNPEIIEMAFGESGMDRHTNERPRMIRIWRHPNKEILEARKRKHRILIIARQLQKKVEKMHKLLDVFKQYCEAKIDEIENTDSHEELEEISADEIDTDNDSR
ncbi:uncharacterized protein LOC135171776 [Diachasmimorpha longicaudata]